MSNRYGSGAVVDTNLALLLGLTTLVAASNVCTVADTDGKVRTGMGNRVLETSYQSPELSSFGVRDCCRGLGSTDTANVNLRIGLRIFALGCLDGKVWKLLKLNPCESEGLGFSLGYTITKGQILLKGCYLFHKAFIATMHPIIHMHAQDAAQTGTSIQQEDARLQWMSSESKAL